MKHVYKSGSSPLFMVSDNLIPVTGRCVLGLGGGGARLIGGASNLGFKTLRLARHAIHSRFRFAHLTLVRAIGILNALRRAIPVCLLEDSAACVCLAACAWSATADSSPSAGAPASASAVLIAALVFTKLDCVPCYAASRLATSSLKRI